MTLSLPNLKDWDRLAALFWPERCSACGKLHYDPGGEQQRFFCAACRDTLIDISSACTGCGIPFEPGTTPHLCGRCLCDPPAFDRLDGLYEYGGAISQAILRFKFGRNPGLARPLGALLCEKARQIPAPDLVVPVPIHPARLRRRGFNHAALIARPVARTLKCPFEPRLLVRVHDGTPQARLSRTERLRLMEDAIEIGRGSVVEGRKILVIDDVATTGTTAHVAASALKRAGAHSVGILTLARAS